MRLGNSAKRPSPEFFTMRPRCSAISRRCPLHPRSYALGGDMLDADHAALLIDQLLNVQSILGRAGCALGRTRTNNGRDTKGAKTRFIAPAYGKFESSSLQQTVCLSPNFTRVSGTAQVFRHFGGDAGRQGRERHRGAKQPAKRSASVSVGRYSSTAVLPDAARDIGSAGRERGQVSDFGEL
jgi:hypothetical protein